MNLSLAVTTIGHISQAAKDCIELRRRLNVESVWLIFNELPLEIRARSTVESVCDDYDRLRKEHHYGDNCALRRVV